ncbi:MAG: hypothetical protein AAFO82_22495, partial [Bacteroidota bacterium]
MEEQKFYKYTTIGLLILNLSVLAFFIFTNPPRPEARDQRSPRRAVDILQLDEQQKVAFHQLVRKHGKKMRDLNEEN